MPQDDVWELDDLEERAAAPLFDDGPNKPCPMCGARIALDARRCDSCGEELAPPFPNEIDRKLQEKRQRFRRECHALAGFWIFFGILNALLGGLLLAGYDVMPGGEVGLNDLVGGISLTVGALWIGAGLGAAIKSMPAVTCGLIVSYLVLLGNLINFGPQSLCSLVLLGLVIVQGHRVLKFAQELRRSGVDIR